LSITEYFTKLKSKLKDPSYRRGINIATANYRIKRKIYIDDYIENLAREVRKIKEFSIDNLEEMVKIAMDTLRENGCEVYLAENAKKALEIVKDLVKPGDILVKGKSMTTEEIMLREELTEYGVELWETDLGELLIQLANEFPSHPVTPAIHMTRETIAELLREKLNANVSSDPEDITRFVRGFLRKKFINAAIGMTGANAVSARDGVILTMENEGNIRLSSGLPDKYIAVVGIEKIVPTIQDAFRVLEVTWRYAGYKVINYINAVAGPSKTGDIEKIIVKGVHGPREVHVIFLDNGRSEMAKHPVFKEALYCLRCGACIYECPLFQVAGGNFGYKYIAGIGAIWVYHTISKKIGLSMAYSCLRDGRCKIVCPLKIDTPKMILELRKSHE